jgi:hypothetical protein
VAVERLGAELPEQRGLGDGVAAETQEILEAEAELHVSREKLRRPKTRNLVPDRPHRIQPHGLVAGGV